MVISDPQSAQIVQKQESGHNAYVIMKTMYHPDYQLMHSCCNSCTLAHDVCDIRCCQTLYIYTHTHTYIYIYIYIYMYNRYNINYIIQLYIYYINYIIQLYIERDR